MRSPCRPRMLRISTGRPPALPNQCGSRVSNSAASPGAEHEVVIAQDQAQPSG